MRITYSHPQSQASDHEPQPSSREGRGGVNKFILSPRFFREIPEMSTLASRNRVHCTHADEGDDMLVRGVRVPMAAEGREEAAEAVPEPGLPVEALERLRRYYAEQCRAFREAHEARKKQAQAFFEGRLQAEPERAVKGDEGE